jgi:hypothetical protein
MNYKFVQFCVDDNLLYVIQKVTSENTEDILLYLYEAATAVTTDFAANGRGRNLNRRNKFFYKKNISIPIQLEVYSYDFTDKKKNGQVPNVHVYIKFPQSKRYLSVEQLDQLYETNIEKSIGLVDEIPHLINFDIPEIKVNKNLRKVL